MSKKVKNLEWKMGRRKKAYAVDVTVTDVSEDEDGIMTITLNSRNGKKYTTTFNLNEEAGRKAFETSGWEVGSEHSWIVDRKGNEVDVRSFRDAFGVQDDSFTMMVNSLTGEIMKVYPIGLGESIKNDEKALERLMESERRS